jgi:hypothetical protein
LLQHKGLKTYQVIRRRSAQLWHRLNKIAVSNKQYVTYDVVISVDGFYIEHGDLQAEEESIDRLWLVVRSLKNPEGKFDYKINKFDAIKLGRVRFRVKDFRCEQMHLTEKELFT